MHDSCNDSVHDGMQGRFTAAPSYRQRTKSPDSRKWVVLLEAWGFRTHGPPTGSTADGGVEDSVVLPQVNAIHTRKDCVTVVYAADDRCVDQDNNCSVMVGF